MNRTLLNVVVVMPSLLATFLLGMRYGDSRQGQGNVRNEICLAASPVQPPMFSLDSLLPSGDVNRGCSLDVPPWESSGVTGGSTHFDKSDGQTHYQMEWDNAKQTFVFEERPIPPKELFTYIGVGFPLDQSMKEEGVAFSRNIQPPASAGGYL